MKILKIAAVQGAVHAQHLLALMHEKQGNYTKATFWYDQAAARNYTPAQIKRAWLYLTIEGNPVKAEMWLKRAVILGDPHARRITKSLLGKVHPTSKEKQLIKLLK